MCRDDDHEMLFDIASCESPRSPSCFDALSLIKTVNDPFAMSLIDESVIMDFDTVAEWDEYHDFVASNAKHESSEALNGEIAKVELEVVTVVDTSTTSKVERKPTLKRKLAAKQRAAKAPKATPRGSKTTPSKSTVPPTIKKKNCERKVHGGTKNPHAKVVQRKVKQRGYERTYRSRLRDQRSQDESMWIEYEAQFRTLLTHKPVLIQESREKNSLLSKCMNEAHAYCSLQEERAYLVCVENWRQALDIWGVETEASCLTRYQINALPQPQPYPTFTDFVW
uniref:BZIP domain-containing protein n=1 Tax=Globisporangium ultimum (strain ATCC 200006 / CBS 805.95 / DAOM BR144) TaxID=431595 RepID=K3W5R5_GLOUD